MCLGSKVVKALAKNPDYDNRPVTVTGSQIGVDDPKDTTQATESLKIQRQKEEGIYVDPNLATSKLLAKGKGPLKKWGSLATVVNRA